MIAMTSLCPLGLSGAPPHYAGENGWNGQNTTLSVSQNWWRGEAIQGQDAALDPPEMPLSVIASVCKSKKGVEEQPQGERTALPKDPFSPDSSAGAPQQTSQGLPLLFSPQMTSKLSGSQLPSIRLCALSCLAASPSPATSPTCGQCPLLKRPVAMGFGAPSE